MTHCNVSLRNFLAPSKNRFSEISVNSGSIPSQVRKG